MDYSQPEEEDPLWKVWMTRILVAAAIVLVVEYWGKPPTPEAHRKEPENVAFMQYSELSRNDKKINEADPNEEVEVAEEPNNEEEVEGVKKMADKADMYDEKEAEADKNVESKDEKEVEKEEKKEAEQLPKAKPPKDSTAARPTRPAPTAQPEDNTPKPIVFRNKLNRHPGMEEFHRWYDIETSLFRQYNVGRTDGKEVIPPYVKKSRNGQVRIALRVTNQLTDPTRDQRINVYWINYMGHEELKGTIIRGETWHQNTYPEHPWVFRLSDTDEVLVHYIPERVIPHTEEAPTIEESHPMVGVQRFVINRPTQQAMRENLICSIDDKIMPHPASHHFFHSNLAHDWTLLHMQRLEYFTYNPGATLLCKYLANIAMHPDKPNYRRIRIANKNFASGIWQTPARGLLLAAGFVEQHAYAELGTAASLSADLVQEVSLVFHRIEQCLAALGQSVDNGTTQQPEGADGSGRAGFGRAGQMNLRS